MLSFKKTMLNFKKTILSFKKNYIFSPFTPSAQQVQSTSLYQGHLNIYLPGLLEGGRSELKCKFVL